jgi:hypothetical protein
VAIHAAAICNVGIARSKPGEKSLGDGHVNQAIVGKFRKPLVLAGYGAHCSGGRFLKI